MSMQETQNEINRFERALQEAVAQQHQNREELIRLNAQVTATASVRDEYANRIKVLEGIVANLILREPESMLRALQRLLVDDGPAVAEAIRSLVKVAVVNEAVLPVLW